MARQYYRGKRSTYRKPRRSSYYDGQYPSAGLERALQHIEDARRLSEELGGTDEDVKSYFFSLPPAALKRILDQYESRFGGRAREYAEQTMPDWRRGTVKMSGTVAERLFKLLPPQMPLSAKYKLTESLWKHVGPRSKKRLRVGLSTPLSEIIEIIQDHIDQVVVSYKVPGNLERRFEWLAAGDVAVKQDLLNHLRQLEKSLVVEGARVQLPVMMEHLRSPANSYTHKLSQTLIVGKHDLEIILDQSFAGAALEEWTPPGRSLSISSGIDGWFWFWIIAAGIVVFSLLS